MSERHSRYWVSMKQAMVLLNLTAEKSFYKMISKGKLESRFRFGKRYVWSPEIQERYLKVRGMSFGRESMRGLSEGEVDLLWEPVPRKKPVSPNRKPASSQAAPRTRRKIAPGLTGEELEHLTALDHREPGKHGPSSGERGKTELREEIDDELVKLEEKISGLSKIVEKVNGKKEEKVLRSYERDLSGKIGMLSKTLKQKDSEIEQLDSKLKETTSRLNDLKNSIHTLQEEKPTRVEAWIVPPGREEIPPRGDGNGGKRRHPQPLHARSREKPQSRRKGPSPAESFIPLNMGNKAGPSSRRKQKSHSRVLIAVGSIVVLAFITGLLLLSLITF